MPGERDRDFAYVADPSTLLRAARRAARGKTLAADAREFLLDLPGPVLELHRELTRGTYAPGAFRTFEIADPKPRTISAAPFRDRVVHHALMFAVEPHLDRALVSNTYACRPGKGTHAAVAHARRAVVRHPFALRMDVRHFFETLDHDVLCRLLRRRIPCERTRALMEVFVRHGAPGSAPGKGVAIGNLTSQHGANLYLSPLDRFVLAQPSVNDYVRYMDDLVVVGDSRDALWAVAQRIATFAQDRLRLTMKESATAVMPVFAGVPFLGFRLFPGLVRLDGARRRRWFRRVGPLLRLDEGVEPDDKAIESMRSMNAWIDTADTWRLKRSALCDTRHSTRGNRQALTG